MKEVQAKSCHLVCRDPEATNQIIPSCLLFCFYIEKTGSPSLCSQERKNMVATGQEIVREKKILQGQGKVREFHFESGKIYIFEKSQGKVKF